MTSHFIEQCVHGRIVRQCRCIGPHEVQIVDCPDACRRNALTVAELAHIPGFEGSIGPFPGQYNQPHVYARDVHSGAGSCVCGMNLADARHIQAAPGVPIPEGMRS